MIELSHISKIYEMGGEKVYALKDISLTINVGEFVAIMGPSGSGKSTLLNVLGLLDKTDGGIFKLFGRDITKFSENEITRLRSQVIGFIFQQFHLLKKTTARDNVTLPHLYFKSKDARTPEDVLGIVGLSSRIFHKTQELSGGQQQRVAIARGLINNPKILFADEPTGNLDSKSEKEILEILKSLHEKGMTILMVTHEESVAEYADRVIRLRDGNIISDTKETTLLPFKDFDFEPPQKIDFSYLKKFVSLAYQNILANKIRSFLSMLGIMIGVASVITMLAIGQGAQDSIEEQFSSLGANTLFIKSGPARFRASGTDANKITRFTEDDIPFIKKSSPMISSVSASAEGRANLIYKNKNAQTSVIGSDQESVFVNNLELSYGRFITQDEEKRRERVAIIGATVVKNLFEEDNPLGKYIKINQSRYLVIGILKEKGSSGFNDADDIIYIPLSTAMKRLYNKKYLDTITVLVKDKNKLDEAQEAIENFIYKYKKVSEEDNSFSVRNFSSFKDALTSTTKILSYLLGIVAAISLLVGGIGIMNIMMVTITERTREIGLRKAIGASGLAILLQFLIESVIISLAGGIIGIFFGVALALLISLFLGWNISITFFSIFISTFFSVAIGIIFGILPAKKASILKPIDALRYE